VWREEAGVLDRTLEKVNETSTAVGVRLWVAPKSENVLASYDVHASVALHQCFRTEDLRASVRFHFAFTSPALTIVLGAGGTGL
jgi:hypothetical protein